MFRYDFLLQTKAITTQTTTKAEGPFVFSEEARNTSFPRKSKAKRSEQKAFQRKLEIRRTNHNISAIKSYHKRKAEKAALSTMSQQTPSRNNDGNEPDPVTTPVSLVNGALLFRLTSPCLIAHAFPLSFRTVWGVWSHPYSWCYAVQRRRGSARSHASWWYYAGRRQRGSFDPAQVLQWSP